MARSLLRWKNHDKVVAKRLHAYRSWGKLHFREKQKLIDYGKYFHNYVWNYFLVFAECWVFVQIIKFNT